MLRRLRPVFLLVTILLGVGGYFATTSSWEDLYKIKGPAWFGTEADAKIVDAGNFVEMSWQSGNVEATHSSRDHVRVLYDLEVDGKTYRYPYEDGWVEVEPEAAAAQTVRVTYLPEDPANNYPITKDYLYADQMTGFVIGLLLSLIALIMALVWLKGMIRGVPEPQAPAPAQG